MANLSKKYLIALLVFFSFRAVGQFEMADSTGNRVVIKPFSPPVGAVIQDLLYSQAKIFLAPDIYGTNHNLLDSRGKSVIVFFTKKDCANCEDGLKALEELKKEFGDKIEIFAFSNDSKNNLLQYYIAKPDYNVMFNSKIFGEMMYAGSLGYPRLFYINKQGYITKIMPGETFEQTNKIEELILKTVREIEQERKEIQN